MTDVSWNTILLLAVRHIAGWLGGLLVHKGWLDASGLEGFIGAIMTLAAVAGSYWQKTGQAAALSELRIMADYWRNRNKPAASGGVKP